MNGQSHISLVLKLFYINQYLNRVPVIVRFVPSFLLKVIYTLLSRHVAHFEIPISMKLGKRLSIFHGFGIVISRFATIGDDVVIRQNTTIGTIGAGNLAPTLEDFVDIGANCVIIGGITVGTGAKIGAGSVVTKDIPPHSTVVGNPARILDAKEPQP